MNIWEGIEESLHRIRDQLRGGGAAPRMPTIDELAYRVEAMRRGDPVQERGPGIGVPTPSGEDYLTAAMDAVTPIPVGLGTMAVRDPLNTLANQVSTRFPTAASRTENPLLEHDLIVSYGSQQLEPEKFARNIELIQDYPSVPAGSSIEDFIERARENLNFLYENVEPSVRERTRQWYVGGNRLSNEAAELYGTTPEAAAAIYATQSPQKDWFQNVSLGDRIMDAMANLQGHPWTPAMDARLDTMSLSKSNRPVAERIRGKRLMDLSDPTEKALWIRINDEAHRLRSHPFVTPEGERLGTVMGETTGRYVPTVWQSVPTIAKAVRIYDDPSIGSISQNLGQKHKVRSFYNNLITPWSLRGDVTMDTHAVAASMFSPFGGSSVPVAHNLATSVKGVPGSPGSEITGQYGTYGIHGEAYERAARDQGILPREMQSITWEAIRRLFANKSDPMKAAAASVWSDYARGLLTHYQARKKVLDLFGGEIPPPSWMSQ